VKYTYFIFTQEEKKLNNFRFWHQNCTNR